jgi:hypothetical protein
VDAHKWESLETDSFWAGMKATDHVIHLYEDDRSLLDSLTGFASSSFRSDFGVVAIASKSHLDLLENNLRKEGQNVFEHQVSGKYLTMNARELLSQFIFSGMPDKALFNYILTSFSLRSRRLGKGIRVFAELAGILHADGNHAAATTLEGWWDQYRASAPFCFFRACRSSDLPHQPSLSELASRHSVVIGDQT